MRGAIACTFALAACSTRGIDVHVIAPSDGTAVDRVTLFVGDSSTTMISISPENRAWDMPVGAIGWQHDVPDLACGTSKTDACRLPERFIYEPYGRTTIGTIVAIGEQNGQVVAAGEIGDLVFGEDLLRVDIPLAAASPVQGSTAAIYAETWAPDPSLGLPTCAIFNDGRKSVAVVDLADPDCDGFPTSDSKLECVPDVYMATRGPTTLDEITCAKYTPTSVNGESVCVLGGPACVDGQGIATSGAGLCSDSAVCLPRTACDACVQSAGTTGTPMEALACLEDMSVGHLFTSTTAGRLTCQVRVDTQQSPAQVCGGKQTFDLSTAVGTCNSVAIRTATSQQWDSSAVLAGPATVAVQLQTGTCIVELDVAPGPQQTIMQGAGALVAMSIGTAGRGAAIPLELKYTTGACDVTANIICTPALNSGDALAACIGLPVPPNTKFGN